MRTPVVAPAPKAVPVRAAAIDAPARIKGRIDAIDGRRLFGWVWDEARPDDRVGVRLLRDERVLATGLADQSRVDLRRNGIGDGGHAFDLDLSDEALESRERLTLLAVSPTTGESLALSLPEPSALAAEAAITAPMLRVLERLEVLIGAQRRLQLSQKDLVDRVGVLDARLEGPRFLEGAAEEALAAAHRQGEDVVQRLSDLDVFLLRFDSTLAAFDERLGALAAEAQKPLRRATILLAFLSLLAATSSIAAFALLLLRR